MVYEIILVVGMALLVLLFAPSVIANVTLLIGAINGVAEKRRRQSFPRR